MNIRSVGSGEDWNLATHGCCLHILLASPDGQIRVGSAMAPVDKPFSTPPPMQLHFARPERRRTIIWCWEERGRKEWSWEFLTCCYLAWTVGRSEMISEETSPTRALAPIHARTNETHTGAVVPGGDATLSSRCGRQSDGARIVPRTRSGWLAKIYSLSLLNRAIFWGGKIFVGDLK